jgi:methyltransferase
MTLTIAILIFVTLQRGAELVLARRNTARLRARGAVEVAPGHYPLLIALHAAWLAGLWIAAASGLTAGPGLALLAIFVVLQGLRLWVLATLGPRWTTRILVMPGEPLIRRGPYRFLNHPNYAVVIGEIFILPMAFGLVWYAMVFSLLNGLLLYVRVSTEDRALRGTRPIDDRSQSAS